MGLRLQVDEDEDELVRQTDVSEDRDMLADSFVVRNGNFVRGNLRISAAGEVWMNRSTRHYEGLSPRDIQHLRVIGKGISSQVSLGRHRKGVLMALKVINMYEKSKRQQIMEEIAALYSADCVALVGFYGAFYQEGAISIALEYMDQGCLATVLQNYGRLPESVVASVAYQALWGLGYLKHEKRVHRDVKPQNILLNAKGEVKLTDFGISKELENSLALCQTFVGTFKYMSPERIRSEPYDFSSDIWSLGIVLLEAFLGIYPYPRCESHIEMAQTIMECDAPRLGERDGSADFRQFICCCLRKNPKDRVHPEVLLEHGPWFQNLQMEEIYDARKILKAWFKSMNVNPVEGNFSQAQQATFIQHQDHQMNLYNHGQQQQVFQQQQHRFSQHQQQGEMAENPRKQAFTFRNTYQSPPRKFMHPHPPPPSEKDRTGFTRRNSQLSITQ